MMNILIYHSKYQSQESKEYKTPQNFCSSLDICSARVCLKLMIFKTATFEVIVRILRVTFQGYSHCKPFKKIKYKD